MITALKLLNKIRWDPNLKKEDYVVGFLDKGKIKRVPFVKITIEKGNKFSFCIEDSEIPFHRIRKVWWQGKLVWERG